ncbi:S-adenosyl-L-methionine-dependent methyltransferase [Lentithecium fluviatile CBS 122367]|uniref:S-adenosyl-L-methionine-dependent methyltransferase n=1 Tax=Lentithecium fluviatile CBS 122367 TaxID=1168545 RepID=A0A6G1IYF4_9PLEO|nr:S-adenosyl-L-methionine-dependent methyltransferase [Lentithecium fluviatile CBS 122367]
MSANPSAPLSNANQDRLRTHFTGHEAAAHSKRWDDLWSEGTFLPWDRGHANPALIDALNERTSILGSPLKPDGTRKRALVPGCGKGYDIALFAAHGYDSFGIEVSENAVRVSEGYLKDPGEGPLEGEYKVKDEKVGRGGMKCLLGNFFEDGDGWVEGCGGIGEGFDVIYDNTFLCALHPTLRPAWARRMHQLLASTGVLICLEFPTHKPAASGGPPWSLPSIVHEELFKLPGEDISYDEGQKPLVSDRKAVEKTLVRVAHWQPARTHKVGVINGEVKDRVSLWKHKGA